MPLTTKGNKRKSNPEEAVTPASKPKRVRVREKPDISSGFKSYLLQPQWKDYLKEEFQKEYFKDLEKKIDDEIAAGKHVYPPKNVVFNALNRTPPQNVKVLLLGQDPYHGEGQAMGLSFSVPPGVRLPPSLKNIFKELENDIPDFKNIDNGCLDKWADQGVLLLNATLTVRKGEPNCHSQYGWQTFTDEVIKVVSEKSPGAVFMLWGNFAHKKEKLVDTDKHVVLKTAHPSPLSCSKFFGCKCFSKANEELKKLGREIVDWKL